MSSQKGVPTLVTDPTTGQQLIVYQQVPANSKRAPASIRPSHSSILPTRQALRPGRRRRRSLRRLRRAVFTSGAIAMFFFSWIPTGMGFPGVTILWWGLMLAYFMFRAVR